MVHLVCKLLTLPCLTLESGLPSLHKLADRVYTRRNPKYSHSSLVSWWLVTYAANETDKCRCALSTSLLDMITSYLCSPNRFQDSGGRIPYFLARPSPASCFTLETGINRTFGSHILRATRKMPSYMCEAQCWMNVFFFFFFFFFF